MPKSAAPVSRAACAALDADDPLRALRERFFIPDGLIYLDGNSLGPMPRAAVAAFTRTIEQEWARDLIGSWNSAGWFDLPAKLGDRLGALIGAAPGQTVVCDTTSINLYKAVHAAIGMRPGRDIVVAEAGSFPTDLYIIEGAMAAGGRAIQRRLVRHDVPLEDLLDERVAVVVLSHVDYRSGELLDVAEVTRKIHAVGALAVWDLCHSAGVIPFAFDADEVDFAVGCTYKYLNGGPGSPAYVAVARRLLAQARNPLSGWWGHAAPFAFERDFRPDAGIRRFLCGTQPILSMRGVEAGLDALDGVGVEALRLRSLELTDLFMARVGALLPELEIVTPRERARRGSQVAIAFEEGYPVVQAMIARGVVGDFRAPDIMRFGFAPAYLGRTEVWDAAEILAECVRAEVWRDARFSRRHAVT
ncbi:MAG: kynureninase [Roseiarcus sp.]|jgi:kynureninase